MINKPPLIGDSDRSDVICDYLDVTCSPNDSFMDDLHDWLALNGLTVLHGDSNSSTFSCERGGSLKLQQKFNFHRASASGSFVGYLREVGLFRDYVNLLGSVPHKVTRLDVAVDVAIDAPLVLEQLHSSYGGSFSFGRKALRTHFNESHRLSDGVVTGTWYAGHRSKARVTCRVYDKQDEQLQRGIITPPLTRYELTFRKDYGCSLWDVLMPKSIFYSHSSGLLEPDTKGYDEWASRGLVPWVSEPVDTTLTVERFTKRVMYSPDLQYLAVMAARFGPQGKDIILREFERLLNDSFEPTAGVSVA